jgi:NADPH-dependent 2,4-dienoyl-CoA reductase/sulfur reductase-like enzyme
VTTGAGAVLGYDALVLSPGIDMRWDALPGYDEAAAERAPHAWKGGSQFQLLRAQLEAMPDGGTFVMVVPDNPYRCPSAPYERASLVAHYFSQAKPRSKILILDAKDMFSMETRFREAWPVLYGDMIEWVARSNDGRVLRVDAAAMEVETEFGERIRADVLNVIPPQQAGAIAWQGGLVEERYGFAPVKPATFESEIAPDVYVIGDAAIAAPMPKSAFLANAQAKTAATAIVAKLEGREPPPPSWINACYGLIAPNYGVSVVNVYRLENGAIAEIGAGTVDGTSPIHGGPRFRASEAANSVASNRALAGDSWGA